MAKRSCMMKTCQDDSKFQHAAAQFGCSRQSNVHREWQESGLGPPLQQHALYVLRRDCTPHSTGQDLQATPTPMLGTTTFTWTGPTHSLQHDLGCGRAQGIGSLEVGCIYGPKGRIHRPAYKSHAPRNVPGNCTPYSCTIACRCKARPSVQGS